MRRRGIDRRSKRDRDPSTTGGAHGVRGPATARSAWLLEHAAPGRADRTGGSPEATC